MFLPLLFCKRGSDNYRKWKRWGKRGSSWDCLPKVNTRYQLLVTSLLRRSLILTWSSLQGIFKEHASSKPTHRASTPTSGTTIACSRWPYGQIDLSSIAQITSTWMLILLFICRQACNFYGFLFLFSFCFLFCVARKKNMERGATVTSVYCYYHDHQPHVLL